MAWTGNICKEWVKVDIRWLNVEHKAASWLHVDVVPNYTTLPVVPNSL